MELKTTYYETTKEDHTMETFRLAEERLQALSVKKLVIASTTGDTARKAMEYFKDKQVQLIIVPHQYFFNGKENAFPKSLVEELKKQGHEVHFGTMLFHTEKLYASSIPSVIADFLRCFCEGVKVCYEIVLMACDACLLENGESIIAIAGTSKGADTALVMQAASTRSFEKLKVNEIICKPRNQY